MVKLPGGITIISGHSSQSLNLVPGRNWATSSAHPTAATAAIRKAKKKRGKILEGQSPVISSPPEDTRVPHCSASLAKRQCVNFMRKCGLEREDQLHLGPPFTGLRAGDWFLHRGHQLLPFAVARIDRLVAREIALGIEGVRRLHEHE